MPVIAIIGGIGSGKSTVREIFEKFGAAGIDADSLARKVVEPGTVGSSLVRSAFGEDFFRPDGRLDRKRLADMVFKNKAARMKLEGILHPLIREAETRLVRQALKKKTGQVVVVEIPLLVEGGRSPAYDGIVLVTAAEEIRLGRLVESGAYSREEALARMNSQAAEEDRAGIADWKIDNSGSVEETKKQVEIIFRDLSRPKRKKGDGGKSEHGT